MLKLIASTLLAFSLTACQTIDSPRTLSLEKANETPAQYRDQIVKVCGWATNEFENLNITASRNGIWRNSAGLGLDWLEQEQLTKHQERRCVTGVIEPTCGWDGFVPENIDEYEPPACIGTATSFQWSIRQTELDRN